MLFCTMVIKRNINLYAAGYGRSRCNLVCDACYGIAGCSLCNSENDTVHESSLFGRKIIVIIFSGTEKGVVNMPTPGISSIKYKSGNTAY